MGFSDVKHIAFSTLELVDLVHRLAVSMASYGMREVCTGAGERIGRMVNGTSFAPGLEPVGVETGVNDELVEVECFWKVTEGGLARRFWVHGSEERMWKPSLRILLRQWRSG